MTQNNERNIAMQEAYQIHDSDEYFKARPQLECGDRRKVFYAGHIRGYQAATKVSESEINSLKQRVAELEAWKHQQKRIDELESQLSILKPNPLCDTSCLLSCKMEADAFERECERTKLLEAKLAIAVEALEEVENYAENMSHVGESEIATEANLVIKKLNQLKHKIRTKHDTK